MVASPVVLADGVGFALGRLTLQSGPGAPLRVDIHTTYSIKGSRWYVDVTTPSHYRVEARERPDHKGLQISSSAPVPRSGVKLRVSVVQGGTTYAATYAVPWRGSMGGTMSGASHDTTSHLYAGQQISPSTDPAQQTHRGSDIYGPTTRGQTLTRVSAIISSNTGIPAGKVAVSLYEGNRRKFTDEDPKRLKAGVLLKVPDVVQMTLTQPAQARALKDYLAGMAPNPYLVSPTHEATYQKSTVATWFNGWFTLATAKAVVARTQTLLAKRWKLALLLCLLLATVVTFRGRWAALRQGRKAKQHAQAKVAQIQAEHRRREAEAQRQRDNRAARQRTLQATGPEAIRHQHIERLKRRLADNPHEVSDMLWLARDYLADGNTEGYAHMARLIEAEGTPAQCRRLRALKAG